MPQSITFHKATLQDVSTLVNTRILFALELSGNQDKEAIEVLKKQMTDYFTKATQNNTCISFIATCNNKIAGIGSAAIREQPGNFKNPSGKWAYIMNMYTLPEFRRKGICKNILNLLEEEARKQEVTAFELHATRAGEKVYTQEGFIYYNEPTLRKWI